MYPMTLFETRESNGSISLFKLLEDEAYDIDGLTTDIKLEDLFLRSVEADGRDAWHFQRTVQSLK